MRCLFVIQRRSQAWELRVRREGKTWILGPATCDRDSHVCNWDELHGATSAVFSQSRLLESQYFRVKQERRSKQRTQRRNSQGRRRSQLSVRMWKPKDSVSRRRRGPRITIHGFGERGWCPLQWALLLTLGTWRDLRRWEARKWRCCSSNIIRAFKEVYCKGDKDGIRPVKGNRAFYKVRVMERALLVVIFISTSEFILRAPFVFLIITNNFFKNYFIFYF